MPLKNGTTIPITKETRERLYCSASKRETWDDVINRLLDSAGVK